MRGFLSFIHFAKPLFFLFLLLLPLLWLRLRRRSLTVVLWRSAVLLLLIFALADPYWVSEARKATEKSERVFAFDLSRSIPASMRLWMEKRARESLNPQPGDRFFVFGGEFREVQDWERWLRGEESNNPVRPEGTNLERVLSHLLTLPPAPRSLFIFTDGWETQGAVERIFPSLASFGLKVFPLLPPDRPEITNVAVTRVLTPRHGGKGETINVKVMVENQNLGEVEGRLQLRRDGEVLRDETVRVKPGSQIFTYQATLSDGPMASFSASFASSSPPLDTFSADNQATSWVALREKEKALVLNGGRGEGRYIEEVLKRRGFEVTSLAPGSPPPSPLGYAVVIFNDVERERFPAEYLAEIERHVAGGKGFLMLGGEASFGPGGYRRTPIGSVLPVEPIEPKKEEKNRAIILVIDKSGSMREENRLLYAKEAAKAVIRELKDDDLIGVIGFDIEPFVVVPLARVGGVRRGFAAQVDRLKAQGRTYLFPAIVEAKRQLESQGAGRKHVIILSDGETGGAGGDYVDLVGAMKEELRITVSAVAIGHEANVPLLTRISRYGGGLFHHTYNPATLPQIALQELEERPEKEPPGEREFVPVPLRGSELLAGFTPRSYPPLKGYIETKIKKGAHVDLAVSRVETAPPLLASWRYGKGKAVAFTTDLGGRWSAEWIRWEHLERFWGRLFEWLRPAEEPLPPHEIRIAIEAGKPVLELYLYAERNGGQFRYSFSGKGGKGEGILKKLAPGRYQASLPFYIPGDYRIGLVEERGGRRVSYPPVGYTLPFDPRSEVPQGEFNLSLLEEIARITGGKINPEDEEKMVAKELIETFTPLRSYLIFSALTLFLAEFLLRIYLIS